MKKELKLLAYVFFSALMTIFVSCKKDAEIPTVTTTTVSLITETTAESGGTVTSSGGVDVIARGICWSTSHNPTAAGSKTIDGTGSGTFTSNMTDLSPNTAYYVRAYAVNSVGTSYGNEVSFISSQIGLATLTTTEVTSITSKGAISGGNITAEGGDPITARGVCWGTEINPTISNNKTTDESGIGSFTSDLTGFLILGTTYFIRAYAVNSAGVAYGNQFSFTTSYAQGEAPRKNDFPGDVRYSASSFSIGTKVYIGLGYDLGSSYLRDFWEWDQATNVWTRKADYPGNSAVEAVSFSIGTKGYIGTGFIFDNGYTKDFWEWDQTTNVWTRKADFPGNARAAAAGFSIGSKGYIGTGGNGNTSFNDFWEWDQATNVWTKKADFAGNALASAIGFSIGSKGYIGTGAVSSTYSNEFWEWDQATNIWTRKADFAGSPRASAVGFSIGNMGYIGTGEEGDTPFFKDLWEWDPATNIWTRKANLAGNARESAVGVSIGTKGYIGTGVGDDINLNPLKDFWEYDPNLK